MLVLKNIENNIATITLNRVEKHNTLVPEFIEEISNAFKEVGANETVRAIILNANGKTFSTGGDVGAFYDHLDDLENYSEEVVGGLNNLVLTMIKCPQPVITVVHGMLTGGSMGLVLGSDIVLVTERATFTPYYATVGYSADGGWSKVIADQIGHKRVAELVYTDTTITAQQAVDWGIANHLVDKDEINEKALAIATKVTTQKLGSVQRAKRLLWDVDRIEAQLNKEKENFIEQILTQEAQNGMKNFLKR